MFPSLVTLLLRLTLGQLSSTVLGCVWCHSWPATMLTEVKCACSVNGLILNPVMENTDKMKTRHAPASLSLWHFSVTPPTTYKGHVSDTSRKPFWKRDMWLLYWRSPASAREDSTAASFRRVMPAKGCNWSLIPCKGLFRALKKLLL